ncbi:alternate-type signal peptide domain-containing protein [uncultured Microbacterium sp.]|uniref:Alternate-type signal peptide domain-containing protein n=1 Tax=uncultured Microbacterium sp. TaxID=191216 RepID=A0A1Y5P911_9MICO|nr:alternate-type signal peptide domain-containing protein [uncultured Microbacterium sp.]SBS72611.1 conserved exported hypothetical protein [uncultured Microbacterium sp.]
MNKIAKASIATAAGVALLLGGAGTFATWNAAADTAGASIVAGNLVVADSGTAGVWTANGSTTPIAIADYAIVPGDVLTYTKTMKIKAEGDSLQATLALAGGSIAAADPAKANDQALAGFLTSSAKLTATGTGIVQTGETFTVTPGAGNIDQNVTITVTITFPKGTDGSNNGAMTGAVNLSTLTVSLTQKTA